MSDEPIPIKPILHRTFHAIIPHPFKLSIFLCPTSGGNEWALPTYMPEDGFFPVVGPLNNGLKESLGLDVITLRCLNVEIDREVKRSLDAVYCMENRSPDWTPSGLARWVNREELAGLQLTIDGQRPTIEDWFSDMERGTIPPRRAPWAVRGWYDAATQWMRDQLALYSIEMEGPPEQIKQWGISCILKARTSSGDYYLKAANSLFAREPVITEALSRLYPGQVPNPLAMLVEPEQGWMLLRDFGGHDLREATASELAEPLRAHARMQIGCIEQVDGLLASGFADRRLSVLAAQARDLLADPASLGGLTDEEAGKLKAALPQIERMCLQLESYGIPQTMVHGDFHAGNIISREGKHLVFDWTDACIAHPFLDLVTITDNDDSGSMTEDERNRLLNAYLGEWIAYASMSTLLEAARLARVLGALHQAISYKQIIASLEDAARWDFGWAIAQWLRPLTREIG